MKKALITISLIFICIISFAKTKKSQQNYDENKCFELLQKIVKTSDYNAVFKKNITQKIM